MARPFTLFGLLDGNVIILTDEGRGVYETAVIADNVGSILQHDADSLSLSLKAGIQPLIDMSGCVDLLGLPEKLITLRSRF
jgi:hypothetical protein